jgi:DNA-binding GntR family transcriptional regulator
MQTDRIVTSLTQAIIDHQLKPGAKLGEQRQALIRLAESKLIVLASGRGASVAAPSMDEARQIFAVRRTLEAQLAKDFTRTATVKDIQTMRRHLKDEAQVVRAGRVAERTSMLSDFHALMAELSGNQVLAALLVDLCSRCALITMMVQSNPAAQHSHKEHVMILDAIEAGDSRLAARLMDEHLRSVELALSLDNEELNDTPSRSLVKALR